ncbi:cystatin domain-containing protein, partial [Escherichia coli]|nr:cystatin domain-containing protein [Escherichia coli]
NITKETTFPPTATLLFGNSQAEMKFLLIACLLPCVVLSQIPGGITDTNVLPTDEPVVFAVQAVNDYFATNGDTDQRTLVEVVHARSQVVAGEKLYLTLHLTGAPTDDYCDVTVWFRAWIQDPAERLIVTDGPTCSKTAPARRRRQVVGGESERHTYSTAPQEVVDALNFAVCALNDRSNAMFLSTLGDTSSVEYTTQVTSGVTYRFYNVPLAETSCRKESRCVLTDLNACNVRVGGMTQTCQFVVQWQAWMTPAYTLTSFSC